MEIQTSDKPWAMNTVKERFPGITLVQVAARYMIHPDKDLTSYLFIRSRNQDAALHDFNFSLTVLKLYYHLNVYSIVSL